MDGSKILKEERANEDIYFIYGTGGISGFNYNGEYIYRKNLQGDITHIYDINGSLAARYVYDAWGNHKVYNDVDIVVYDSSIGLTAGYEMHIGNINPFRYRGYYFDKDIGLYYLNSRYYDSEIGRFINANREQMVGNEQMGTGVFVK